MKTDTKIAIVVNVVALAFALAMGWLLHCKVEAALANKTSAKVAEVVWFNQAGPLEKIPGWVGIKAYKGGMPVYNSPSQRRVNVLTTC